MDPHSFIARAEAQRWLGIAEKLLMTHDLVGSKTFAIRARESDPRLEAADQILAIADTLLAAEKRVVGNNGIQQPDFYAILQLVRFVQETEHIASQYRRLAVLLNPHQNRFPYSDQAFQLVNDAWALLSNPIRKSMYDAELDFAPQQQQQQQQQQQMDNLGFNLEQQHHHQQHHHHQQQQQQPQHNFFSINHMGTGHESELPESQQSFQTRVQRGHQQQQLQQHNFLSQNPVRPVPVREQEQLFQHRDQEQLFQHHVQPFQVTSIPQQQTRPPPQPSQPPPPAAPPQPPFSWPQAQLSQPQLQQFQRQQELELQQQQQQQQQQRQLQQEQQQPDSLEQNAPDVHLLNQVNNNNGVRDEETELEAEAEAVADGDHVDDSSTFWTACPYCLYMYEYPRVFADFTLRCDNCKRAFQAVPVSSPPPPIIQGQDAYYYCWGFFPLGVSMSHLQKKNGTCTNSNWTPFSSLNDVSSNVQDHLNDRAAPKKKIFGNKNSGPRIYIDDETDDIFMGISEPSDDSDLEWNSTKKKKAKRMKRGFKPNYLKKAQVVTVRVTDARNGNNKDMQDGKEDLRVPSLPVAETSKKALGVNTRSQSGRVAKELGKLDLNVEFNNNEGEEPAARMASGNRGNGQGDGENIEGIGFFEGLDEFFSSLPILSVVNDDKVKAG